MVRFSLWKGGLSALALPSLAECCFPNVPVTASGVGSGLFADGRGRLGRLRNASTGSGSTRGEGNRIIEPDSGLVGEGRGSALGGLEAGLLSQVVPTDNYLWHRMSGGVVVPGSQPVA